MQILFIMRHPAAVRSLGSVLRLLDERGHRVHLAFRRVKTAESHLVLQRLADECSGLTFGPLPGRGSPGWVGGRSGWDHLAAQLRLDADYLRYLEPRYAEATGLRARAERKARPLVRQLARGVGRLGPSGVRALRSALHGVERCLEPPPHVGRFVADRRPDLVVSTHLAELGSTQADYVRAAKRHGIHTAYLVFSWDNLSNKGLVRDLPELVLVWNEIQAQEAVELQGIPRERVRVTGASAYDHWFDWQPSRSRDELCRETGLRPDRPILLYVCSSHFVAPDEVAFVRRWIAALRARGGALGEAGVIVRPHPRNAKQWGQASLDAPWVAIWPRFGEEPLDEGSRRNYFDSIYHAAAIVGINTSAQIESAIVGRPVHTVLAEEFRETQQGTLHFHYLKADEFGHLHVGRTMDEHLDQLERSLEAGPVDPRNERFVRRFVRPLGLDVAASPVAVEALEELAARPSPEPERAPALAPLVRLALRPAVRSAARARAAERREKVLGPAEELRRAVRKLGRTPDERPIVVGPWLGDEVGELLYWIPFLRWAQAVTFGLRDRLVVAARPTSLPWYSGIGVRRVPADEDGPLAGDAEALPASWIADIRGELSLRQPSERSLARMLEFAPLEPPELPPDLELPDDFVATDGAVARDLLERHPVVALDGRPADLAILARASAFVGRYGATAYLAALLGVNAVALHDGEAAEDDLRLAASFLGRPPFGRVAAIEAGAPPERVLELVETATATGDLAGV